LIDGIKREFQELSGKLEKKILDECRKIFLEEYNQIVQDDPFTISDNISSSIEYNISNQEERIKKSIAALSRWFNNLSEEKKNFVHHGDPGILTTHCRDNPLMDEKAFLKLAEKLTGLQISSWSDEMLIKFNTKLESAKKYISTFEPPPPPVSPVTPPPLSPFNAQLPHIPSVPIDPVLPNQAWITHTIQGGQKKRIIEIMEELSPNGQALENMLNATVDQIGRSLDEKEKTAIIYRFMKKHFFN